MFQGFPRKPVGDSGNLCSPPQTPNNKRLFLCLRLLHAQNVACHLHKQIKGEKNNRFSALLCLNAGGSNDDDDEEDCAACQSVLVFILGKDLVTVIALAHDPHHFHTHQTIKRGLVLSMEA